MGVADVAVDVFVVAVVGFAAALALGMVVGRKRAQEMRVLVLLVALLGVAGLVHGVRVAARTPETNVALGGGGSTPGATPTGATTSTAPPTSTKPVEPPSDRTAEFIKLIGSENYVPSDEMEKSGAAGPTSRGTWPCRAPEGDAVVWPYQLGGTYNKFHAVARLTGNPGPWPKTTFTVYADDKQLVSVVLDPIDDADALTKFEAIDVELDRRADPPPRGRCRLKSEAASR